MRNPVIPDPRRALGLLFALALLALGAIPGLAPASLLAQGTGQITGVVTGANAAPVAGALVAVPGTAAATRTGPDGRYTLTGVAAGARRVRVEFVGFAAQEQTVTVAAGQTATVNFQMEAQAVGLQELVVVGYTTQARRTVTGAVSSVSAEQLQDRQVATVEEALRGRVPGVHVVSSGEPGRASQVIVRGQNFLSAVEPLYVVDGMYTRQNPALNPEDIESIQVLKDASAAAQYGAQSANGVIVITTRRGRAGAPRIAVNSYVGYQEVPRRIEMVDASRWLEINNLARANAGQPTFTAPNSFNTDWQDAVFQRGGIQDHNVTVSGGSENASYLIGAGVLDQVGTIINTGFERYSFRVNSEARRGRLRIGQNASLSRFVRENVVGFPLIDVVRFQPLIPVRDPNNAGGFGFGSGSGPLATFGTNPVGGFEREDNRDLSNRVLGNLYGELGITDYLRYRVNLGVDYQDLNWNQFIRQVQIRQNSPPAFNEGLDRRDNTLNLLQEHLLTFDNAFGDHSINAVAGVTEQSGRFERLEAYRRGFANENITQIDAGTASFQNRGFEIPSALRGYLVRANYSFADRYLVTGTFRRDGSSRFGASNRWANFAAGSLGWVVSEESFYNTVPVLGNAVDYLKLRASYGSLGNQDIGDFQYAAAIASNQSYVFGGTVASGATQLALANPDIRWQDQTQTNVGVDFALLDNRLSMSADYYVSESGGLLVRAPIPWSLGSGFNSVTAAPTVNAGTIRNRGFEFGAQYRHQVGDVEMNFGANLTTIRNEVVELGNGGQPIFAGFEGVSRTTVGGSVGEFFVIKTAGLFRSEAEVQAHRNSKGQVIQPRAKPGDVRFVDFNDDGQINDLDRQVAGSPIPDFEGGFNFDATYRSFNFGLAMRGSQGAEVFNVARFWTGRLDENHGYRADLDPWTPQNPNARDPRPLFGTAGAEGNARPRSDRWIEDASYLRIQNVVLGYVLPTSLTQRLGLAGERSRVYLNIQNAHTFTGFSNWDPEIRGGDSPLARGIEDGRIYPNPRTFTLGVDLSL
jgi:TonB-linked SusC/RagA family outer membrane protein